VFWGVVVGIIATALLGCIPLFGSLLAGFIAGVVVGGVGGGISWFFKWEFRNIKC